MKSTIWSPIFLSFFFFWLLQVNFLFAQETFSQLNEQYLKAVSANKNPEAGDLSLRIATLLNNSSDAEQYYLKAIQHFRMGNKPDRAAEAYEKCATFLLTNKKYREASMYFAQAGKAYESMKNTYGIATAYLEAGKALNVVKDYKASLTLLKKSYDLMPQIDDNKIKIDCYKACLEAAGNQPIAIEIQKKYVEIIEDEKKRIAQEKEEYSKYAEKAQENLTIYALRAKDKDSALTASEIQKMEIESQKRVLTEKYDELQKQKELEEKLAKEQLEKKERELAEERRLITLGVVGFFIVGVFIIFMFRANFSINRKNKILEVQRKQLEDQKEQITKMVSDLENSYENMKVLSAMGQSITATLDKTELTQIAYQSVEKFMEVSIFGIGFIESDLSDINFMIFDEQKKRLPDFSRPMDNHELPAVKAFKEGKEIVYGDATSELPPHILKGIYPHDKPVRRSFIYLPLETEGQKLGVLTIQHYNPNVFNNYHIAILKTLSVYISIAMNNASTFNELENAKGLIEEKNKNIFDSIRYAEKIQTGILPKLNISTAHIQGVFAIYKPKDIVSGDFYWYTTMKDCVVAVAADCTGHGIPGAFMSMIGNVLLNEIVRQKQIKEPNKILEELHIGVRKSLQQENNINDDGMDVCICVIRKINEHEHKVLFAGAKRPLFIYQNNDIEVIKGDKHSIGGVQKEEHRIFTTREFKVPKNTMLYLTTDGFADQSGESGLKYGSKRMIDKFKEVANLPLDEQRHLLQTDLETHQGSQQQRDDISLLGIRV